MSIWKYANPVLFMKTSGWVLRYLVPVTVVLMVTGLLWGFFFTPPEMKQGATVKIIFLHVPTAMLGINAWLMMLVASLIWLVRRHHVSALAAKAAAPVGATMTLAALISGAIWGEPMWGTWWAWDPRLTSFLILFLFYLGYMALWEAVEDPDTAADLTSVLCLVGSVFAILSRYAVNFWNQGLHQGPSLTIAQKQHVADAYWYPLMISIGGFLCFFVVMVLLRTRTEIRARRLKALLARERMA